MIYTVVPHNTNAESITNYENDSVRDIIDKISEEQEKEYPNEEKLTDEDKLELEEIIKEQVALIEKETENLELNSFAALSGKYNNSLTVSKIYRTNLKTANSIKKSYNQYKKSRGITFANSYRLSIFYTLVKSNGAWDLKRTLGTKSKYTFMGTKKTGEYIGNHHYGYMGKAIEFSNTVLKIAAGMYQIYSGTSKWKYISSYFDDPVDQKAITKGYTDYNKGYRFPTPIA